MSDTRPRWYTLPRWFGGSTLPIWHRLYLEFMWRRHGQEWLERYCRKLADRFAETLVRIAEQAAGAWSELGAEMEQTARTVSRAFENGQRRSPRATPPQGGWGR